MSNNLGIGDLPGLRATVMGLGLHGGGAAAARFLAEHGCEVTVTDLRSEDVLRPSIEKLSDLPLRYVLGRHDEDDFGNADLVIKNPAVPVTAPLLALARRIETDISLFLRFASPKIIAVTGSKGKSTTVSAIHHILLRSKTEAYLGGNITTSPLSFFDSVRDESTVVLELSSWQLADVAGMGLLDPEVSMVLNIMRDHQNRYASMADYATDKSAICAEQSAGHSVVLNYDDPVVSGFAGLTTARKRYFSTNRLPAEISGGWIDGTRMIVRHDGDTRFTFDGGLLVPGEHTRVNMLAAAVSLLEIGVEGDDLAEGMASFPGIRHRLETVALKQGVRYVNDTAATIPDATLAAARSFREPVHLIAGGTDKELDFSSVGLLDVASIHLLSGSATEHIIEVLTDAGISFHGPFPSLEETFESARRAAEPGSVVLFSPGSTSFELFRNEFDRGDRFCDLVKKIPD